MRINSISNMVRIFHDDEDGLEAVQVVMIVAIAAMIMVAMSTLGSQVVTWMKEKWDALKGQTISL